jgi:uncharacterized protein with NAD-binding domain and iron-sulfur cluster
MSIDRRDFLVGLGSAGVLATLAACANDAASPDRSPTTTSAAGDAPGTAEARGPLKRPDGTGPWVVVLGGGVAGMSAAHELRARGLPVTVLEKRPIPGGKARSLPVPESARGDRRDLPGEHGFRFFPGFYRHLPDTMKRIPYGKNPGGVFDNLVAAPATTMARAGRPDITLPLTKLDLTLDNAVPIFNGLLIDLFGLTADEAGYFNGQMARFLTSCDQRRFEVHEQQDWWKFVGADRFSENYRRMLVIGVTRNTVAARAEEASARTIGLVIARFLNQLGSGGDALDRLLNGPTNDVWIQPWLDHLRASGVDYRLDTTVTGLSVTGGRVTGAVIDRGDGPEEVAADEFVLALPVERAREVIPADVAAAAPELRGLASLKTEWMNGIQYYLSEPAPLVAGHVNYLDSPWALTSVSQQQFWPAFPLATGFGDGSIQDVLSVDISNWTTKGIRYGKPAIECTAEEIADEVWQQIKAHLDNVAGEDLPDRIRSSWFLDPAITFPSTGQASNDEPLLVNTAGSWFNRPDATTSIANLFLASDYVRTSTDLATMEAANEAARRAVNAILEKHRISEEPCEIFELEEPPYLEELRDLDVDRFASGQPNLLDEPVPAGTR